MLDDDLWDEERWESFLRKDDERVSRYMQILNRFLDEHPPPKSDDRDVQMKWRATFKAYLIQYGWQLDDIESALSRSDEYELSDESAAYKDYADEIIESITENPFEELSALPVYQESLYITRQVLSWSDELPGELKDSTLVQFCACVMQTTANIAKGHGIGLERDMLGGNIACLKRAIKAANNALTLLGELKNQSYMHPDTYRLFYERMYELRNALGIYIQDLRDRFDLGID